MARDVPWKKAIEKVLRDTGESMHYREIASQIIADGLRKKVGATPAATVSSNITSSIRQEGADSPFRRVRRGEYILKDFDATSHSKLA